MLYDRIYTMNHHSREVKKYLIKKHQSIQNVYFLRRCTSKLVESKTFLQVTQFYVFSGLLKLSTETTIQKGHFSSETACINF